MGPLSEAFEGGYAGRNTAIAAIPGGDDAIVDSPAKSDSKKKGHGIFEHNFQDSFDAEREELMEDLS